MSQNGYGAHKCAVGLNSLGLPMKNCLRQCLGQGLRLEVILLSNEKAAAPDPSPEAGRGWMDAGTKLQRAWPLDV